MTGIFLQVRLDSLRLPNKALLNLENHCVISHAMHALNEVHADIRCILTTEDSRNKLKPLTEKTGWQIFTGARDDVLSRYVHAGRHYGVRRIIRATGDNPLVSASMANAALALSKCSNSHYTGFSSLPVGAGVEILDFVALEEAHAEALDSYEREHVAPFLYHRPQRFRILRPQAPQRVRMPNLRITLDTEEDYAFLQLLFSTLYHGKPIELFEVVKWFKENPSYGS